MHPTQSKPLHILLTLSTTCVLCMCLGTPLPAAACSVSASVGVWPVPESGGVAQNVVLWIPNGGLRHIETTLIDDDGAAVDLDMLQLQGDTGLRAHWSIRPTQNLRANTTYTVRLHVEKAASSGLTEVPEGVQSETLEDGSYVLSWSFQTGEGVEQGIEGQEIEEPVWGWIRNDAGFGYGCDRMGPVQYISYINPMPIGEYTPVLYRFELHSGPQHAAHAYHTQQHSNGHRVKIAFASHTQTSCGQWVAFDGYGHEVRSEVICTPDVCTDVTGQPVAERPPYGEESDFLAIGNALCTAGSSEQPNLPEEPPETPTQTADDPPQQPSNPNTADDSGCSIRSPHTAPLRTPTPWLLALSSSLFLIRRSQHPRAV